LEIRMPSIEFIYETGCPNIDAARRNLRSALERAGLAPLWTEWERNDPQTPVHARRYGSPTILIDGHDAAGVAPSEEPSCRIYAMTPGNERGVPSVDLIARALAPHAAAPATAKAKAGLSVATMLPVVGAALLPKLTCPACWPAYAALLSSLGLGFVDYTPWLLPATALFVALTLASLALGARARRAYGPLLLGVAASAVILFSKFGFDTDTVVYLGIAALVGASVWNAWPRKAACSACVPVHTPVS
jgi:hypothetical protein